MDQSYFCNANWFHVLLFYWHLYANFEMSHLATLESALKCAIILSYRPPIPLAKPTPNSFKSAPKITSSKPPKSPLISYKQPLKFVLKYSPKSAPSKSPNSSTFCPHAAPKSPLIEPLIQS
jgi:hypothetical protein